MLCMHSLERRFPGCLQTNAMTVLSSMRLSLLETQQILSRRISTPSLCHAPATRPTPAWSQADCASMRSEQPCSTQSMPVHVPEALLCWRRSTQ